MYKVYTGITITLDDEFIIWAWRNINDKVEYIGVTNDVVPKMTSHFGWKRWSYDSLDEALQHILGFYDTNLSVTYKALYHGGGRVNPADSQVLNDFNTQFCKIADRDAKLTVYVSDSDSDSEGDEGDYHDDDYDDEDEDEDDYSLLFHDHDYN